jgi:hypothetical protein
MRHLAILLATSLLFSVVQTSFPGLSRDHRQKEDASIQRRRCLYAVNDVSVTYGRELAARSGGRGLFSVPSVLSV